MIFSLNFRGAKIPSINNVPPTPTYPVEEKDKVNAIKIIKTANFSNM